MILIITMAKKYKLLPVFCAIFAVFLPKGVQRDIQTGVKNSRVNPLIMHGVEIPSYKPHGETALLLCKYVVDANNLYSVKWYKDDEEFYRFLPRSKPQITSYLIDGVNVDRRLSDRKQVVLRSLSLPSSGVYRCEVSAEGPSFVSAQREARMQVLFLPKENPVITGNKNKTYHVGEEVHLNCTSAKSSPASSLRWYINDNEVTDPEKLVDIPAVEHEYGLISSSLGLVFVVSERDFPGGKLRIRCEACVPPSAWQGNRTLPFVPLHVKETTLLVYGGSQRKSEPSVLLLLVAICVTMGIPAITFFTAA